ncbi:hypothetical protein F5Y07DRAFT_37204 [Xylaria sp. FL0933]|nr:hypothetical protein F5Y07DRAFT_37204 [Xylaria sp. FL0933]
MGRRSLWTSQLFGMLQTVSAWCVRAALGPWARSQVSPSSRGPLLYEASWATVVCWQGFPASRGPCLRSDAQSMHVVPTDGVAHAPKHSG